MDKQFLDTETIEIIHKFISKYGRGGLKIALKNYENQHSFYLVETRNVKKKIPISTIKYFEIFNHDIIIHTDKEDLAKYGSLNNEYEKLKQLGFVRCNRNTIISINKIQKICGTELVLDTGEKIAISRSCRTAVLNAYVRKNDYV